jgi:hypothetical protein
MRFIDGIGKVLCFQAEGVGGIFHFSLSPSSQFAVYSGLRFGCKDFICLPDGIMCNGCQPMFLTGQYPVMVVTLPYLSCSSSGQSILRFS